MAGAMQYYRSRWLRYGGLCVVSVLVFLGASLMHERALESAISDEVQRAVLFADDTMSPLVAGTDVKAPLPASVSEPMTQKLVTDVLTGSSVVRIRIFARDGSLIYSTDDGDRLGTRSAGDLDAVAAAAEGQTSGREEFDRVSSEGVTQSLRVLSTYVPLSTRGGKAAAVLSVDQRYRPIADETSQPWRAFQLVGVAGAVVFLELFLLWLARNISAARLASRSGFQPPPGSPARSMSEKDAKAAEKQAKAQAALEQQLETLRAQVRSQEEAAAGATASLQQRLHDAEQRAAKAEGAGDDAMLQSAKDRAAASEQKAAQADRRVQEAEARVAELVAEVRLLQDRPAGTPPAADPEEIQRLTEELHEQTRRAEEHEQRARDALHASGELERSAASVEAARAELDAKLAMAIADQQAAAARATALEVELADVRSKAEEATDLAREGGRRVEEANAAGDAVREDLKRTTTERDDLVARAAALEAARDEAERAIGDADARAMAAESRLAAAASDLSTESATLAAELDAERERSRRVQERAVEAERRGDEMDKHASSLAQALEDERVQRDQARVEAAEMRSELEEVRAAAATAQGAAEEAATAARALAEQKEELEGSLRETVSAQEAAAAEAAALRDQLVAAREELTATASDAGASADHLRALTEESATLRAEMDALVENAGAAERRAAELQTANAEMEQRVTALQAANAELDSKLVARAAAPPPDDDRVRDLEREVTTLREELDSMGMRLRRAYADAEDARAQLQAAPPGPVVSLADAGGPASADGLDEIHRLRLELGRTVERANAAEARASRLQADLSQGRGDDPTTAGADLDDEDEDGQTDDERSLRFRLAKTAARKKGMDPPAKGGGGRAASS